MGMISMIRKGQTNKIWGYFSKGCFQTQFPQVMRMAIMPKSGFSVLVFSSKVTSQVQLKHATSAWMASHVAVTHSTAMLSQSLGATVNPTEKMPNETWKTHMSPIYLHGGQKKWPPCNPSLASCAQICTCIQRHDTIRAVTWRALIFHKSVLYFLRTCWNCMSLSCSHLLPSTLFPRFFRNWKVENKKFAMFQAL